MPVACPVAVAQQAQYERTEAADKLNYCVGGENLLVVPLLEISHFAYPCHWSQRLGTGTVLLIPGLPSCPC